MYMLTAFFPQRTVVIQYPEKYGVVVRKLYVYCIQYTLLIFENQAGGKGDCISVIRVRLESSSLSLSLVVLISVNFQSQ